MFSIIPNPKEIRINKGVCPSNCRVNYFNRTMESFESYSIEINPNEVNIFYSAPAGKFYAENTLKQIRIFYPDYLPCANINDTPVFSFRGFMLDSSRHFISVDEIKRIVDIAAFFKLNRFHWHLSDDQGFRIELDSFKELTEKGSIRQGDNYRLLPASKKIHSGYYTKEQIKDVVNYCKDRFIEVIPEIDMPGHVSAILHVYPQYHCQKMPVEIKTKEGIFPDIFCAGNPETYTFIFSLLDEITELFPYEFFHVGGDEAPKAHWKKCPDCQNKMRELGIKNENDFQVYFGNTVAHYLKSKGKKVIMWNDILKGKGLDKDIVIQKWMDIKNLSLPETNKGRKTVISNFKPYYADYPYEMYPLKNVFSYDPFGNKHLTKIGKESILGIESPVWLEFIDTPEKLEYMIFPRWFAVANTAWSCNNKGKYNEFKKSCVFLSAELQKRGINCAPEKALDPSTAARLKGTLKFFRNIKE